MQAMNQDVPRKPSYADVMNLDVEYAGTNPVGQHLWKNGSPLVTDITSTLEEAVARWGARIKTHEKQYRLSGPYATGKKATAYVPREGADRQELLEYRLGYIAGLIARGAPAPAPVKPRVQPPVPATAPASIKPADTPKPPAPVNQPRSAPPVQRAPASSPLGKSFLAAVAKKSQQRSGQ